MPFHLRDDGKPVVAFDPRLEISPFALFRRLDEGEASCCWSTSAGRRRAARRSRAPSGSPTTTGSRRPRSMWSCSTTTAAPRWSWRRA